MVTSGIVTTTVEAQRRKSSIGMLNSFAAGWRREVDAVAVAAGGAAEGPRRLLTTDPAVGSIETANGRSVAIAPTLVPLLGAFTGVAGVPLGLLMGYRPK
jgi:anti-sigma-K factor RskA